MNNASTVIIAHGQVKLTADNFGDTKNIYLNDMLYVPDLQTSSNEKLHYDSQKSGTFKDKKIQIKYDRIYILVANLTCFKKKTII